jgi:hypothetical protein
MFAIPRQNTANSTIMRFSTFLQARKVEKGPFGA